MRTIQTANPTILPIHRMMHAPPVRVSTGVYPPVPIDARSHAHGRHVLRLLHVPHPGSRPRRELRDVWVPDRQEAGRGDHPEASGRTRGWTCKRRLLEKGPPLCFPPRPGRTLRTILPTRPSSIRRAAPQPRRSAARPRVPQTGRQALMPQAPRRRAPWPPRDGSCPQNGRSRSSGP